MEAALLKHTTAVAPASLSMMSAMDNVSELVDPSFAMERASQVQTTIYARLMERFNVFPIMKEQDVMGPVPMGQYLVQMTSVYDPTLTSTTQAVMENASTETHLVEEAAVVDTSTAMERVQILRGSKCVMGNASMLQYNAMVSVQPEEANVVIGVCFL